MMNGKNKEKKKSDCSLLWCVVAEDYFKRLEP